MAIAQPATTANSKAFESSRPNVLMILADDLGYGDLGCFGRQDIRTPNLDRLASEGVRFTDHYANGAECTPTRAAFLTGRYQQRIGGLECAIGTGNVGRYDDAIRLRQTNDLGLPVDEPTLMSMLHDAGYQTWLCGKWHLGYEPKFAPHLHGFDHTFYCIGGGMDYFHFLDTVAGYNLFREGQPVSADGYFTDLMTDDAIKLIQNRNDSPFFLYLAYTCPHAPFQGPDDRQVDPLPLDSPLWNQGDAPPDVYVKMIEHMDRRIGDVLKTLEQQTLASNTLVIFAGDNGGTRSARNAPLSGFKGSTFEGGIRVPGMIRWTGKIPAGLTCETPCLTLDFTKSIIQLAGAKPSPEKPLEGIDIVQHVLDGCPPIDRTLYWRKQRGTQVWKAVREGTLKYVAEDRPENQQESLFDLSADIAEQQDLKSERPEDFQRLRGKYLSWEQEVRRNRRGRPDPLGATSR
ncbi:sulfatase-like hydrolase/transferase [Roseiconus nitratireducens]|uniref:Sulfatase-like hydrolase/transferase n=2 Tax=Roseiconus nitratireducens TaxID=2605748 RepID=A0A5M6CV37_9BACT|nr:sulfatase-like hydrolase/transferase [Roseiconus nitratireducens]